MLGSILGVVSTGNQGVILGDYGVRYTFTLAGWREVTSNCV